MIARQHEREPGLDGGRRDEPQGQRQALNQILGDDADLHG
jgi:hypothetical protein